jgi:hypothetical protein
MPSARVEAYVFPPNINFRTPVLINKMISSKNKYNKFIVEIKPYTKSSSLVQRRALLPVGNPL